MCMQVLSMSVFSSVGLLGRVAVAGYLLLVPLAAVMVDRIGGHDLARVAQLALGLICALTLLPVPGADEARWSVRHVALASLCVGLAMLSTLQAPVPAMAARELGLFAGMAAVAWVVARRDDPIDVPARLASAASAAYVVVISMMVLAGHFAGQPLNRAEIFVGYDNYRFYNHVQSAALPLAVLALTVTPRGSWSHRVALVAAVGGLRCSTRLRAGAPWSASPRVPCLSR